MKLYQISGEISKNNPLLKSFGISARKMRRLFSYDHVQVTRIFQHHKLKIAGNNSNLACGTTLVFLEKSISIMHTHTHTCYWMMAFLSWMIIIIQYIYTKSDCDLTEKSPGNLKKVILERTQWSSFGTDNSKYLLCSVGRVLRLPWLSFGTNNSVLLTER